MFSRSNQQSNGFITKYFRSYSPQLFNESSFPLLALPQNFNSYKWSGVKESVGGEAIPVPEVDKILTEYCNVSLQTLFTIELVEFVNRQFLLFGLSAENKKLEYTVNFYKTICNLPLMTNDDEIRKTLSFYFDNPFDFNFPFGLSNHFGLAQLKKTLEPAAKKYFEQLAQTTLFHQSKSFKVSDERAQHLIKTANAEMEKDINDYFVGAKGKAAQIEISNVTPNSPAEQLADDKRIRAMLDVIVYAEGTGNDYGKIANGVVKKSPYYPELIGQRNVRVTNFSRHPEISVDYGPDWTTAAGRYQFLYKTWKDAGGDSYDFSPRSQDIIAVKLMLRRKMIEPLLKGNIRTAIHRGSPEWASLPMENGKSYHNQPVKKIEELEKIYNESIKK